MPSAGRGDEADPVGGGDHPGDAALLAEADRQRRAAGEARTGQAEAERGHAEAEHDAVEVGREHRPDEADRGDQRAPQDQSARA